jgi:hypothetical protein
MRHNGEQMAIGQFGNKTVAGNGAKPAAPAKRASKWAGVKSSKPRDPIPHAGLYRFKLLRAEPGRTGEWFKIHLEIVDQAAGQTMHANGDHVAVLFRTVDDAGQSRCKAFFVAAAGYDDDASYDAVDADGAMIDAFFERGDDSQLAGRLVDCRVARGKDMPDGSDYYREYEFSPVADAEQA